MYLEQAKEIIQGKSWDDTEQNQQQVQEDGGFFGGLLSSFTSLFASDEPRPSQQFRQQRENRTDDVSNLLWNMRSSNML